MEKNTGIRWGWLKFMYWYTAIGAGGFGLGMLLAPQFVQTVFKFPKQDPVVFGLAGGVYAAFALLAILGLRAPLKYAPVLVLQLCSKSIWLVAVVLPLAVSGSFPLHAAILFAIFATYIIGDLIAIPFPYVFEKQGDPRWHYAAEEEASS